MLFQKFFWIFILFSIRDCHCEDRQLSTKNYSIKSNERLLKFVSRPGNETHLGPVFVEAFEDLASPTLDVTIQANHNFELLRRTLNFCSFVKTGKQNFMTNVFINHILAHVNPELLKCPIKKGLYKATGARAKQSNELMNLPPFVQPGQEINFLVIFKSVIHKKTELVCSVTLDLTVS